MFTANSRKVWLQIVSIALLSAGFSQFSFAGAIDTSYMMDTDSRAESLSRVQELLAEESVAEQLEKLGVDKSAIDERLQGMTTAELVSLEARLDEEVAASGVLGVVGAVFLVLLILELVGVTDIFKAI